MKRRLLAVAVAFVVVGCGSSPSTQAPEERPLASTSHPVYAIDAASDHALLTIEVTGFFPPDGLPVLVVYGDGRVLRSERAGKYPFTLPMLTSFTETSLGPDDLQKLVAAADDAGLLGPDAHFEATDITDQDSHVYTLAVAGRTHRISTYGPWDAEGPDQQARKRLDRFFEQAIEGLAAIVGHGLTWSPFVPNEVEVRFTEPYDAGTPRATAEAAWPLSVDPGTALVPRVSPRRGCLVLGGSDVAAFATNAANSPSRAIWAAGSGLWEIQARPILPGQRGCVNP